MDTPHVLNASDRRISVDWSLVAITLAAVALLVLTTVRTGAPPAPGDDARAGGLAVLGAHETLVAFEDFSFGARGWTSTATSGPAAIDAVFGPFAVGTVMKRFDLPLDTAQVRLAFDLHLTGNAPDDAFSVRVNGEPVIAGASTLSPARAVVSRQAGSGGYAVWILLDQPGEAISLEVEARPGPDAAWAIDNVSVVAAGAGS